MHIAFLGNGIIALTSAFRLLAQLGENDKITIVGDGQRYGSATLAAAAMLNSFAEIETGTFKSEIDLYKFELSRLAARAWPDFERAILESAAANDGSYLSGRQTFSDQDTLGTYIINNTAADDLDDENFDAILSALREYDEPYEMVSPRDIPNYAPLQKFRATRALYLPREGWYNPRLVMSALDAALRSSPQVEIIDASIDRLACSHGEIEYVALANGTKLTADQFILAAGATATDILKRSDIDLDMQRVFYGVGISIEIKSPDFPHEKCIRTPNRGLACGVYSVPYPRGYDLKNDHILIGATNFLSATPYDYGRLTSVETLMRGAIEQINTNFYRADFVRVNVGWRPTSQDTYPLIGRTSIANLIVATGTKRDGFHLSPIFSEKIVALICNASVDERFLQFAPERKVIRNLSREEAIDQAVRHQMNAAYQHGFSPATTRMPEDIEQMFRDKLERLHDEVGAQDWGIPPEMIDMYRYGHAK